MSKDGLVDIVLDKKWNKHKKGSTVRVDPVRAKWLTDNDFATSDNDFGTSAKAKKRNK